jgi:hypothetical protein
MQSLKERAEMNRVLARRGFAQLGDAGVLAQLAYAVENERTLKQVLNLCEADERTTCYESLRPYLPFTPRPLDVLLAEIRMDAEIRQLPIVQSDGTLRAFNVQEVQSGSMDTKTGSPAHEQGQPADSATADEDAGGITS